MRISIVVGLGGFAGLLLVFAVSTLDAGAPLSGPLVSARPMFDEATQPAPAGRVSASASAHRLGGAVVVEQTPGEDELSGRWDELSAEERVAVLREQFEAAVGAMNEGRHWQTERARAEAALSELRAELYATAEGRLEHHRLERELDRLVDGPYAQLAQRGGRAP